MHGVKKDIKNLMGQAVDVILPPRCAVTGQYVDRQGMVSSAAWRDLSFITKPYCDSCGVPLVFEMGDMTVCASCSRETPPFDKARSALVYDDGCRQMVLRFKHADQTHIVHAFVPWLLQAGKDFLPEVDFIIPVPLHRYRLLRRRYNQAGLMASALARQVSGSFVPDLLLRHKATVSQGYMNFGQRQENVKNAFALNPRYKHIMQGKNIVLVDDVFTTGATVRECTRTLKRAGAGGVYVLTLARTVRPEMNF